jgi:hypothetical protein
MRVGSSPFSAHQAGMSALWHDADYVPEQRFETPVVRTGLEDFALPTEQHQLPDGVDDPFKKLEAVFEVAAQQMERGIKGANFLHGHKPRVDDVGEARHSQRMIDAQANGVQKGSVASQKMVEAVRTDLEQVRMTNQAAAQPIATTKGASKTAAEKEAVAAAPNMSGVSDALGTAAIFVPMAVGSGVQTAIQGPLPALASQAVTVVGAAGTAGEVMVVGVAEGLKEDAPVQVRRGLHSTPKKA